MRKTSFLAGFTLVELIVVITIVGILSTVGFVSYSGYLSGARDSNRISQLTKLSDSLQTYAASKSLPLPDNAIDITASGTLIAYQGEVGVDVLETIDYTNGGTDPKDDSYYTYYLTKDRNSLQLMALMEEASSVALNNDTTPNTSLNSLLSQGEKKLQNTIPSAHATFEDRFPKVYGRKLGVLTYSDAANPELLNTPANQISANTLAGELDIVQTTTTYTANISDDTGSKITGTGGVLISVNPQASCKRIKQSGKSNGNGIYTINPLGEDFQVYCDMETDGGGWTLVHKTTDSPDNLTGQLNTNEGIANWDNNEEYRLSINYWKNLSTEAVMAKNIRIDGLEWEDISEGIINSISTAGVNFSQSDPYRIFNYGASNGFGQNTCTDGSYYWNSSCCARCINLLSMSSYGVNKQPMLNQLYTSTTESAIEGAGGVNDASFHVLSKMGIFIK